MSRRPSRGIGVRRKKGETDEALKARCAEAHWDELGRRLRAADPESYRKVLAAAEAFLSICDDPDEGEEMFMARVRDISRTGGMLN